MSPTATENMKNNLGEAGTHLKGAATAASEALKGAASAAGEELSLGRANIKSELADGSLAGIAAAEQGRIAAGEQMDVLMDKGRDLLDTATDLIRERPIAAFGIAFATGWVIAKLGRSSSDK